jgi:large subunit ribosomal protein L29
MQANEMRSQTVEELETRLDEAYQELFNLRRDLSLGRLEDHNRITVVKREVARIRTILRERELSAELV